MKTNLRILTLAVALCASLASPALAAEKQEKRERHAGPNGGRNLDGYPHPEFLIEKDRSVTVRFYAHEGKEVKLAPVGEQSITVIAEPKGGKTTIQFEKIGESLVSKGKLPEGNDYNLVVQYKKDAAAKPVNLRFKMNLDTCGECKLQEYACICDH